MRRYTLASPTARADVDLQDFCDIIEEAVHEVMPSALVEVYRNDYIVHPTPSKGDAIRIGRKISKTALGKYCVQIPKLFCSEELELSKEDTDGAKKRDGGHH